VINQEGAEGLVGQYRPPYDTYSLSMYGYRSMEGLGSILNAAGSSHVRGHCEASLFPESSCSLRVMILGVPFSGVSGRFTGRFSPAFNHRSKQIPLARSALMKLNQHPPGSPFCLLLGIFGNPTSFTLLRILIHMPCSPTL
jgi:hypothetical protein